MADLLEIAVSRLRFLRTSEKFLLRDVCGDFETLSRMKTGDLESVVGRKLKINENPMKKIAVEARIAENILATADIKCLFLGDRAYPAQLAEIYDPPYALYYRGRLPSWNKPAVAVVGTRLPTGNAVDAAFKTGFDLARCGIPVVSGLAMGIDRAAHSGCTAAGGYTIAVLGSGPDRITPAVNKDIASELLESGGAVVSEYLPGEDARKHHFPERNRIISGLSRAVVVVEAPGKSGALITADFAVEHGRDLFIHSAGLKRTEGHERVHRLIFDGAPLINGVQDILADWGISSDRLLSGTMEMELKMSTDEAGLKLAEILNEELIGNNINFNGNYFRRACYESSYSINS